MKCIALALMLCYTFAHATNPNINTTEYINQIRKLGYTTYLYRNFLWFNEITTMSLTENNINTMSASEEDYEAEFNKSNALKGINVEKAYELGYTGAGVTVGVIDTVVNTEHQEFADKISAYDPGGETTTGTHGTLVAGIIAASKDGVGMHGVAYNASIYSIGYVYNYSYYNYETMKTIFSENSNVRIYNNSYGISWKCLYSVYGEKGYYTGCNGTATTPLVDPSSFKNNVYVFTSGNDGMLTPSDYGIHPRFKGAGQAANVINVGAYVGNYIYYTSDGTLIVYPYSIAEFSNLAGGAELWTVFAPGYNLYTTTDTTSTDSYGYATGTSVAAPVVSGVLALVLEAYPWLSGKQLADAVLTTANLDFESSGFIATGGTGNKRTTVKCFECGDLNDDSTEEEKQAFWDSIFESEESVVKYFGEGATCEKGDNFYHITTPDGVDVWYHHTVSNVDFYFLTKEQIFGQGFVDAGAAVQGIARLDSNRMTADNVVTISELGDDQHAIEVFDTQGYSGTFSNDISSRTWDDFYHAEDSSLTSNAKADKAALQDIEYVGLEKTGEGTLRLTGNNTYNGATLVTGGILEIAKKSDTDEDSGIIRGVGVVVRNGGILTGNGSIYTQVINSGNVLSSYYNGGGLTVGSISSTGILDIVVKEGEDDATSGALIISSKLVEADALDSTETTATLGENIISGTLNLTFIGLEADTFGTFVANGTEKTTQNAFIITDDDVTIDATPNILLSSPTLIAADKVINEDYTVSFVYTRESDSYSQYATNSEAASIGYFLYNLSYEVKEDSKLANTFAIIDYSSESGVSTALDSLYSAPDISYISQLASLRQQQNFNSMLLAHSLSLNLGTQIWVMPFGSYAKQNGSLLNYEQTSYGALMGVDGIIESKHLLGFHIGVAENIAQNDYSKSDATGVYIGMHSKFDLNAIYVTMQYRMGVEYTDMTRSLDVSTAKYAQQSNATNLLVGTLIGLGSEARFEGFGIGGLVYVEYAHNINATIKNTNSYDFALPDSHIRNLNSLNAVAGITLGYKWDSSIGFDFFGAYKRELLKTNISTYAYFSGYENYGFTYSRMLKDKDFALIELNLKLVSNFGGFMSFGISGEASKNSLIGSGIMQLGWSF